MEHTPILDKIKDIVLYGREIKFSQIGTNLKITIESEAINDKLFILIQELPLQDHFIEEKIVRCIEFMDAKMTKELK